MGYLTPILIRNDDLDLLKEDPQAIDKIYSACIADTEHSISLQRYRTRKHWWQFWKPRVSKNWCSSSGDAINSLGPQHADANRVLVVYGNTWCDIDQEYFKRKYNHNNEPIRNDKIMLDYLESCADIAAQSAKSLKKYITEYRKEHPDEKNN